MTTELASAWPVLVAIGCFSGLASGLLGIGGGTIIVPALVLALPLLGVNGPALPMIAIATSIAIIIPTAIASAQQHGAKGTIDGYSLVLLAPSIIAGSFAAGYFAHTVHPQLLSLLFVIYAFFAARNMLRKQGAVSVIYKASSDSRPNPIKATFLGISGGALSSFTGLGNAFYTVPFMSRFIEIRHAIGTAATLNIPLALAGVIGYVLTSAPPECGTACFGYIYLPAVAAIGISAVLTAPLGARLTHILPVMMLRRIFAIILIFGAGNLAAKTLPVAEVPVYVAHIITKLQTVQFSPGAIAATPPACYADPTARKSRFVAQYGPRREFARFRSECPSISEIDAALTAIHAKSQLPENFWIEPFLRRAHSKPVSDRNMLAPPKPIRRPAVSLRPAGKPKIRAVKTAPKRNEPSGTPGDQAALSPPTRPDPVRPDPDLSFDPFGNQ